MERAKHRVRELKLFLIGGCVVVFVAVVLAWALTYAITQHLKESIVVALVPLALAGAWTCYIVKKSHFFEAADAYIASLEKEQE